MMKSSESKARQELVLSIKKLVVGNSLFLENDWDAELMVRGYRESGGDSLLSMVRALEDMTNEVRSCEIRYRNEIRNIF